MKTLTHKTSKFQMHCQWVALKISRFWASVENSTLSFMLCFSLYWHHCKLHWKQPFICGWMAIAILVFMASMGTWWIVPCVGFHLHMRALSKCTSLSWMRTKNEWMNLNEGVSVLQWLTSDIWIYNTAALPTPHRLLTHSPGKCPLRF